MRLVCDRMFDRKIIGVATANMASMIKNAPAGAL